jgi:hypothetical protein
MDAAELAKQLDAAGNALKAAALAVTGSPIPPTPPGIKTAAELDAALATAKPGDTLLIDPALRYLVPLAINVSVVLCNAVMPLAAMRATLDEAMPSFKDGLTVNAANVHLLGLEVQKIDHLTDIMVINGAGCVLDSCRVLGDPALGAKRGIAGNAPNVTVTRCYVADCFQASPGNDSQAFAAWNSPGPFELTDNYFSGGSETILFGGADPSSAANVPTNITITGNTITKNPAWQSQNIGVKNCIELKNAITVRIEDNDVSYSWGGHGQDGYLLMLTPRNQDGGAPYSIVKDVTITNNRFSHAAAAIGMLGHDSPNTSQSLQQVSITDNDFTDLDPVTWTGTDKMIFVGDGPQQVTITGNLFHGAHIGSVVYLDGSPKALGLNITVNTFPPSTYGVMGSGCAPGTINNPNGSAWTTFVQGGTLAGNIEQA